MTRKHGQALGIEQNPTHTALYTNKMTGSHIQNLTIGY